MAGTSFSASVTVKNTGTNTWNNTYALSPQDPMDNTVWGPNRIYVSGSVNQNSNYTFNFTETAPSTPGTYTNHWGTLQEGVAWFGSTCGKTVTVTPAVPNCSIVSGPATLVAGSTGTYSANFSSPGSNLAGEISYFDASLHFIANQTLTPPSGSFSAPWTPAVAGSYQVCCRAWNDSIAECRNTAVEGNPGPPVYNCAGPTTCIPVTVTPPPMYTVKIHVFDLGTDTGSCISNNSSSVSNAVVALYNGVTLISSAPSNGSGDVTFSNIPTTVTNFNATVTYDSPGATCSSAYVVQDVFSNPRGAGFTQVTCSNTSTSFSFSFAGPVNGDNDVVNAGIVRPANRNTWFSVVGGDAGLPSSISNLGMCSSTFVASDAPYFERKAYTLNGDPAQDVSRGYLFSWGEIVPAGSEYNTTSPQVGAFAKNISSHTAGSYQTDPWLSNIDLTRSQGTTITSSGALAPINPGVYNANVCDFNAMLTSLNGSPYQVTGGGTAVVYVKPGTGGCASNTKLQFVKTIKPTTVGSNIGRLVVLTGTNVEIDSSIGYTCSASAGPRVGLDCGLTLTSAGFSPNIQLTLITTGSINYKSNGTASPTDTPIVFQGGIAAKNGVNLNRANYESPYYPAEVFRYDPKTLYLLTKLERDGESANNVQNYTGIATYDVQWDPAN